MNQRSEDQDSGPKFEPVDARLQVCNQQKSKIKMKSFQFTFHRIKTCFIRSSSVEIYFFRKYIFLGFIVKPVIKLEFDR